MKVKTHGFSLDDISCGNHTIWGNTVVPNCTNMFSWKYILLSETKLSCKQVSTMPWEVIFFFKDYLFNLISCCVFSLFKFTLPLRKQGNQPYYALHFTCYQLLYPKLNAVLILHYVFLTSLIQNNVCVFGVLWSFAEGLKQNKNPINVGSIMWI